MSTHVIVQYAYSFCSKQFKNIQKTVYDTETEETSYIREKRESPFINTNTLTEETLSLTKGNIFHLFFFFFFFWGTSVSPRGHWAHLPGQRCSLHLRTSSPVPSQGCPVMAAPWQVLILLSQPPSQDLEQPLQWPHWFHCPLAERNTPPWSTAEVQC